MSAFTVKSRDCALTRRALLQLSACCCAGEARARLLEPCAHRQSVSKGELHSPVRWDCHAISFHKPLGSTPERGRISAITRGLTGLTSVVGGTLSA